jgi:putative nucleotidyltransferase with HDIG domain
MNTLHKRIPLSQLRPGMYVENVFNENELLLFCADTLISGYHQIESLKKQGVSYIFVNPKKSTEIIKQIYEFSDPKLDDELSALPEIVIEDVRNVLADYEKKLKQAYSVRQKTVYAVRNMLADFRAGRAFSIQSVVSIVEQMVEQVLEDPDVYLRICQLKKHSYNTYVHSVNVSVLMAAFASALGYPKDKIIEASIGGMLHDIGKVKVPEHLLRKGGVYTLQEMEQIRRHPMAGIDILKKMSLKIPDSSYTIIAQHHERINGSGYPQKLKGKQIDELASICAIADVYDTLTSDTNHRKSCLPQEALALIFQGSDEEYPRFLVEYFTKMLGIYPVGSFVKLASHEMGIVVKVNRNSLLTPHVMILFDSESKKVQPPFIRNLFESNEKNVCRIECSLNPENFQVNTDEFITSLENH